MEQNTEGQPSRRLPLPPFPTQFKNRREFGRFGMKWGTGEAAALERMSIITRVELQSIGMDFEMATQWAEFYADWVSQRPENGSARGRARLMAYAAELLRGE
jgi:hypothetical protein